MRLEHLLSGEGALLQRCDLPGSEWKQFVLLSRAACLIGYRHSEKGDAEVASRPGRPVLGSTAPASPIAQLVRAPH